jgi:predicted amidohydrolase YtcJ
MNPYLFHNAKIFLLDGKNNHCEAMVVENDRFKAFGTYQELLLSFPEAIKVDLDGRFVFPGFNDAHIHLWKVGSLLGHTLDLRGVHSKEEMLALLNNFAVNTTSKDWLLARGFNEALWENRALPTCKDLDLLFPDRPCQVMRTCAHIVVVNSFALRLAGIDENTVDPVGGHIGRFENGKPNGILYEAAIKQMTPFIPEITTDEYKKMILEAQEKCLEMGITSITDPEIYNPQRVAYEVLEKEGLLKLRVNLFLVHLPDIKPSNPYLTKDSCTGRLQMDTLKFFADGGLSGQTAAVFRPYKASDNFGVLRMSTDYFYNLASKGQINGWKIATHAIGDAAIDQVLSVYEKLKTEVNHSLVHRIEHLGLPHARHISLMNRLGIICASQPAFVRELGPNFRQYLDTEYQQIVYPYHTLLKEGVTLAFSSDAPVVRDFKPLSGIRDAVQRVDEQGYTHNPQEKIIMEQAFIAYTYGGALADGAGDIKGKMAPHFLADFIVLNKNPFQSSWEDWDQIKIEKVYIGGKLIL